MFKFHGFFRFSIFVAFLVSCAPTNSTNNLVAVTSQVSQAAPNLNDPRASSTHTAQPLFTLTPNTNLTETSIVQSAISTEQALIAPFPHTCQRNYSPREFSPSGVWVEELCYSENDHDLIMTFSNRETKVLWKLLYRDYLFDPVSVPDGSMSIVHWSNDDRYVYFNSFLNTSGGECFVRGNSADGGLGLFRLDLNTGHVATILPLKDSFSWYVYSFSPTGRWLVYGAYARELRILDLNTSELVIINPIIGFSEAGGFLWSLDGSELVYSTVLYNDTSEPIDYSLRLVDAKSGSERILLESANNCFAATAWTQDNILTIEKNFGESLVKFDWNSNKIIGEATKTP